jgi:HAE1 family hydrophobic/amphiphilic exporter-1
VRITRWIAPALALPLAIAAHAADQERPLKLDEAIVLALEKNEAIIIERESLASARASVAGARGAYDPVLDLRSDWERATLPVNSAFSGAPSGKSAPTSEAAGAEASVRQLLPTGGAVSLSAAASRATTDGAFALLSPAYATQVGIEARQPLLRDRATDPARSAIRIAASDRKRAAASLRSEINGTLARVESAYWTLVAARRDVAVREEAVRLAAEQLEETRIRAEKGAVPETEIAQPRAELERRRGEVFASREAAARAESALKVLILADADAAWSERFAPMDEPEVEVIPVKLDEVIDRALASRPELDASRALLDRRKTESALAQDAVRPALDFVASYDRFGLSGSANPAGSGLPGLPIVVPDGMEGKLGRSFGMLGEDRFDDARLGLEFRVPIGNRAARAGAAEAQSAQRQAEADLSRARKTVRAEILDAAAALETAGGRIEASRSAREAAEVQLSSEIDRYAAGLSTNFLVLTRQNDLSRARLDEIAALTDYRKAQAEMGRATGSLLADRHIEIDGTAAGENR